MNRFSNHANEEKINTLACYCIQSSSLLFKRRRQSVMALALANVLVGLGGIGAGIGFTVREHAERKSGQTQEGCH